MATNGRKKISNLIEEAGELKTLVAQDDEVKTLVEDEPKPNPQKITVSSEGYERLLNCWTRWGKPARMEVDGYNYIAYQDGEATVFIKELEKVVPDWLSQNSIAHMLR